MPKPVLQAMVLADHIYRDTGTGKFLIIGTFGTVWRRTRRQPIASDQPAKTAIEGPYQVVPADQVQKAGSPYLYLALTGVHGSVPLQLKCVSLADASVVMEGDITVTSPTPIALAEFSVPLPPINWDAGHYSLDLLHDGEILGSWRVTISVLDAEGTDK